MQIVETDVPARLDRLPWARFHTLVVIALGVTWILDGLEVTLAGSLAGAFKQSLHLSDAEVGMAGSFYLTGAVLGAIVFGWLTDRLGRKKLFFITLSVYLVATAATAASWNVWSFAVFRFFTGAGIGGEYTTINSTIQELIPARVRGWMCACGIGVEFDGSNGEGRARCTGCGAQYVKKNSEVRRQEPE